MMRVPIEISAHHVHLAKEHLEKLFGMGYKLKKLKSLSQPGHFAARENVTIKTKNGEIRNVRILGPIREQTQVEISLTDAHQLKVLPPIHASSILVGTPGAILIGPKGQIKLKEGIIVAWRHIHAHLQDLKKYNLDNGQYVSVKVGGRRALTFHKVLVIADPKYRWSMHIDTDEGNAAGIKGGGWGTIIN